MKIPLDDVRVVLRLYSYPSSRGYAVTSGKVGSSWFARGAVDVKVRPVVYNRPLSIACILYNPLYVEVMLESPSTTEWRTRLGRTS